MNAWYRELVAAHGVGRLGAQAFDGYLHQVRRYEQMLAAEGIVLLKFWIHLSRDEQKARQKALASNPKTAWRVTAEERRALKLYGRYHGTWEHMLRETSIASAPWYVVEGTDARYRMLTVGKILLAALEKVNAGTRSPPRCPCRPAPSVIGNVAIIRRLDLTQRITDATYARELGKHQARLAALTRHKRFRDRALVLAFEGADAAGKGGAIRRVAGALDARQYAIVPVAAPTEEERAQPYLWRFWRHVPAAGGITIFDRTWYGRVLVERVEGYCREADWMRAYDEINQFEEQLTQAGIVVCKFWLQISKDEQLRRFEAREKTRVQAVQDHAGRLAQPASKWNAYEQAVADMVDRTSHRARAVDARRSRGQALRPGEGAAHRRRCAGARARLKDAAQPMPEGSADREDAPFASPAWLRGGHAQTIYPQFLRRPHVAYRRERVDTHDGDFWAFDWLPTPPRHRARRAAGGAVPRPRGQRRSRTTRCALMTLAAQRGWRGVVPHFRGCGGEPNRLPRAYHSGDHEEIGAMLARSARASSRRRRCTRSACRSAAARSSTGSAAPAATPAGRSTPPRRCLGAARPHGRRRSPSTAASTASTRGISCAR